MTALQGTESTKASINQLKVGVTYLLQTMMDFNPLSV